MAGRALAWHAGAPLLFMIALIAPVSAEAAQLSTCPDRPTDVVRAEAMYAEAHDLLRRSDDLEHAARLLERSAVLRPRCDGRVFDSLRMAARLYQYAGDMDQARATMLRAAEHGVWTGNVLAAAHAFVDAASLAAEDGDPLAANVAADRADLLSSSPLLSPVQRMYIRGRIDTVAQLRAGG